MKKHQIVIVDDHQLISRSLKKLIETFSDFEVVGQYANGRAFVDTLKEKDTLPDLVLLDVNMPVMDGKQTMKWIYEHHPSLKVLILSMEDKEDLIIYMLRHGAKGYISKDIDPQDFKEALLCVINKGFYHTERVGNILLGELNQDRKDQIQFSDNERKFLSLVCSEMTYKEIAQTMFLSPKTIDGYREKLFKKIEVKSRTGLVLYAIKNKLVLV